MSTTSTRAHVEPLTTTACVALLAAHRVGRLAYAWRGRVDLVPIGYVHADGYLYLRTAPGEKLRTLAHSPWVAFEVDEVRGPHEWRSVVVHGTVYALRPEGSPVERRTYERALSLLRALDPDVLTDEDPAPERDILLRISIDRMTGRASTIVRDDGLAAPRGLRAEAGDG